MGRTRGPLDPSEVKALLEREKAESGGGKSAPFHNPFAAARDQLASLVPDKTRAAQRLRQRGANPPAEPSELALARRKARAQRDALAAAIRPQRRSSEPALDDEVDEELDHLDVGEEQPRAAAPAAPEPSETRLFADEMAGVTRLAEDVRGRVGTASAKLPPVSRRAMDEAEAYAELADLVEGSGPFTVSETDEYLEFLAPGIDRRILRKLRRGEFAVQAHVDLHGMTAALARREVDELIAKSRQAGRRCVLIVHGRGLHSKDEIPVLKERVKKWLERGAIARSVLAFASARPCDGGTGALYVLLRR